MQWIIITVLAILGSSLGSFISVLIYRIENKKTGSITGRSYCPSCKKQLTPIDLIPIASYILLKGKCRFCKKNISPTYFFLELAGAFLMILIYFKFPFILQNQQTYILSKSNFLSFGLYTINTMILMGVFFYDLKYLKIPDLFLFSFMGISLFTSLILKLNTEINLFIAVVIAIIFFGGQILISKGKWMGEGDLFLGMGMALLFGWQKFLLSIAITYIFGSIISLILLATKKATPKTQIPFAPFMVFGSLATIFYGEQLINLYFQILL